MIVDDSGAVIPKAQVRIKNEGGDVANGVSDMGGRFNAPDLSDGTYEITVQATGFKATRVPSVTASETGTTIRVKLDVTATPMIGVIVGELVAPELQTIPSSLDHQLLPEPAESAQYSQPQTSTSQSSQPQRASGPKKIPS